MIATGKTKKSENLSLMTSRSSLREKILFQDFNFDDKELEWGYGKFFNSITFVMLFEIQHSCYLKLGMTSVENLLISVTMVSLGKATLQ